MQKVQWRRHFIDTAAITSRLCRLLLVCSGSIVTLPFIDFRAAAAWVGTAVVSTALFVTASLGGAALIVTPAQFSAKCVLKLALVTAGIVVAVSALVGFASVPVQPPHLFEPSEALVNKPALERQINDLYCTAKGYQTWEFGTIADVKQLFSLDEWPIHSNHQAGRRVSACCGDYVASLDRWGYHAKMEVCRVCGRIRRRVQSRQQDTAGSDSDDPNDLILQAVVRLTLDELDWCGGYLANQSWATDTSRSPYQKHRKIFQGIDARFKPLSTERDTFTCGLTVLIVVFALVQLGVAKCMVRPLLAPLGTPK